MSPATGFGGGAQRQPQVHAGGLATAAERLQGSSASAEQRKDEKRVDC
jgi:hypothetical protein